MNLFFRCILLICCLGLSFRVDHALAQAVVEGQVLDKATQLPVPFATVTLVKARVATRTNDQGYFNLTAPSVTDKDSLVFTCVGYQTYRMPLLAYQRGMFISMQSVATKLKEVVIGSRKSTRVLEGFPASALDPKEWKFALYNKKLAFAQMYAKLFQAPKDDAVITHIDLGRWQPEPDSWEMQPGKRSRFKIHVMEVDATNGGPGKVIFSKEMDMHDRSRRVSLNLDSAGVFLSSAAFFVAIEWLRIPYNEYIYSWSAYALNNDNALSGGRRQGLDRVVMVSTVHQLVYQPILGQYKRSKKAPSWIKLNDAWKVFDHPDHEIPLSVTVNY